MYIPAHTLEPLLDILILKFQTRLVCIRDNEQIQTQRQQGDHGSGEYIRHHHSVETHSTGEDRHDFRIRCHLRREEDHGYEHEQRTEHIHEIWHKIEIIVKHDSPQRRLLADKIINLLTDVEDDDDADDQKQRHKERCHEFPDNIYIKFPWSEVKLHFFTISLLFF